MKKPVFLIEGVMGFFTFCVKSFSESNDSVQEEFVHYASAFL